MVQREVKISEILGAGGQAPELLGLAQLAKTSFFTEERDGRQVVRAGAPGAVTFRADGVGEMAAEAQSDAGDVAGALRRFFAYASSPDVRIKSRVTPRHHVVCRYEGGRFRI